MFRKDNSSSSFFVNISPFHTTEGHHTSLCRVLNHCIGVCHQHITLISSCFRSWQKFMILLEHKSSCKYTDFIRIKQAISVKIFKLIKYSYTPPPFENKKGPSHILVRKPFVFHTIYSSKSNQRDSMTFLIQA